VVLTEMRCAEHLRQAVQVERFAQNGPGAQLVCAVEHVRRRIRGHHHHSGCRPPAANGREQRQVTRIRETQVEQHDIVPLRAEGAKG